VEGVRQMTHVEKMMWQVLIGYDDMVSFDLIDVGESFADTWHIFGKLDGATWPRHGLPRGTM
jgi:hypothetical protein